MTNLINKITLTDFFFIAVASMTLMATVFLTILGFRFISEFNSSISKIAQLEKEVQKERENLYGSKIITQIMFKYISSSAVFTEIQRRTLLDVLISLKNTPNVSINDQQVAAFEKATGRYVRDIPRLLSYLKLLNADDSDLDDALKDVYGKYRDINTYDFLKALSKVSGELKAEKCDRTAGRIAAKIKLPWKR